MTRTLMCAVAASLLAASNVFAQHEGHGASPIGGHVPRDVIDRPLPLRSGIGTVTHPTSSKSPEAQKYYEQGLAYLHSYVWLEAARSFNQALRLDPELALAWVGLSRTFSGMEDPAAARQAQEKAVALPRTVTPREKRWINLRTLQLDAMEASQDASKLTAYILALDAALDLDLDDAELWLLRGNVEEPGLGAHGRGQRGHASSIAFYKEALSRVPDHFAAHHYLVHSYEQIGQFAKALEHGQKYSAAATNVPHALHMYGHDLMKVGRVQEAIDIFTRARKLEHDYYSNEAIARDYDWHHAHNTNLLAMSYRHMGKVTEATKLVSDAASVKHPDDTRNGYYRGVLADILIARGRYDEALSQADAITAMKMPMIQSLGHAIAARALMASGKVEAAGSHIEKLTPWDPDNLGLGLYAAFVTMTETLARGEWMVRTGDARGVEMLRTALQRARAQRTPDGWIEGLFLLETVFQIGRATGNWELAGDAAAKLLEHDPAYGGTQLAIAQLAAHQGRAEDARRAYSAAANLWSAADADYALVKDVRSHTVKF
jgi:tetratricopeptide (TPR) repeat protein